NIINKARLPQVACEDIRCLSSCRKNGLTEKDTSRANYVHVDTIRCFLCHDHRLAIIAEADLRGAGVSPTERTLRAGDQRQATVAADREPRNVVRDAGVEDV